MGYITTYTETDPTVPAWAKAQTKPSYTASEVGAMKVAHTSGIPSNPQDYEDSTLYYDFSDDAYTEGYPNYDKYICINGTLDRLLPDYSNTFVKIDSTCYNAERETYGLSGSDIHISNENGIFEITSEVTEGAPSIYTDNATVRLNSGDFSILARDTSNENITNLSINPNGITMFGSSVAIHNVVSPTTATDAANKSYVDSAISSITHPVSSVNGSTGAIIIDKVKTTAPSNSTEYSLIGTAENNNNSNAVAIYNPGQIRFAKYVSNYARLTLGSNNTPGVIRLYDNKVQTGGYLDLKPSVQSTTTREIVFPDASGTVALTTDIPNVPSWALANNKPSYTFSELTSHPTTLNDYGITDAYTKTEVDGLVSGVLHYKGTKATVGALPSSGNITGDVWHVTADGSEWAWDGSDWQELGTTVDLSGYLQSSDIAAWAKAANKPSYTASEVGALASNTTYVSTFNGQSGAITYTAPVTSVNGQTGAVTLSIPSTPADISAASATHAHGNITSGGDMTATAAIANGDRLVINDESASKLVSSTITFGSSTTQYLANNGTWQNVPTAPVTSVNGQTGAVTVAVYDDTALAARVTALEQIPWVTYYTGSSAPSNSQGSNGDLYFQTAQ